MLNLLPNHASIGKLILALLSLTIMTTANLESKNHSVYLGTLNRNPDAGIYISTFNSETQQLSSPELAVALPTGAIFLISNQDESLLFAASATPKDTTPSDGVIYSFRINKDHSLTLINSSPTQGVTPCHMRLTRSGNFLLTANYTGGSISVLPVSPNGELGAAVQVVQHSGSSVDEKRQATPHPHSINLSPDERFAFAADLGTDVLTVYEFDAAAGKLTARPDLDFKLQPGAGPRHFSFHPNEKFAYVINELDSTVNVFDYDATTGKLTESQVVVTLPEGYTDKNFPAEVTVHPNGKFLYGNNRGHDTFACFTIDQENGKLSHLAHVHTGGVFARHFVLTPEGNAIIAANQESATVTVLKIAENGIPELTQTLPLDSPASIYFVKQAK